VRPIPGPAGPPRPPERPTPRRIVRAPDLVELRAFCAAADLGSIGSAARLLHVSQPALSKRLRALEAVAGAELLHRSTRGVSLTAAGASLYAAARRLLDDADRVQALMSGLTSQAPPVRLLADPTVAEVWLPGALAGLQHGAVHHLAVDVLSTNSTAVRRMILEGRGEIGLAEIEPATRMSDGVTEHVVWDTEVLVAVPADHRWAFEAEIDAVEFVATPVVRRDPGAASSLAVDRVVEEAGLTAVRPLAEVGSTRAGVAIALAEEAPVLLTEAQIAEHAARGLVARRVCGMRFEQHFGLIFAGGLQDLRPPAREFAAHLLAVGPELPA
jgi:DNA-binding transcriptional LysR family regulator